MAKPLALTSGEPAGIGPDIAIAAWLRRNELKLPPFYLLGDRAFFAERAKILGLQVELADAGPRTRARHLPSVARGRDRRDRNRAARPARRDQRGRRAGLDPPGGRPTSRAGRAGAVVTNPIAKSVLYRAGFRHPGHTEFLAELAAKGGRAPQPVMMLWSPALAVVPVTIHLSLREAHRAALDRADRRDGPHRGRGSEGPFRPRPSAACGLRPQSACRRRRLARQRRHRHRRAGGRIAAQRGHRRPGPAAGRHHVPRRGAQDLRLRASACITTRR